MLRRATLLTGLLLALPAAAQEAWPSRPITILGGFPNGAGTDIYARKLAEPLGRALGQPVVVDNRSGAGGNIASEAVAKARPDGYLFLLGTAGTHAINATLYRSLPFDPLRDVTYITLLGDVPNVLLVNPEKRPQYRSCADLVAAAKARPGGLNYASTGVGSASHLAAELFKTRAGVELQHIPFRGSAPMTTELLAGRIDLTFATLPSVISHIDTGAVRALAVASARRASRLPNLPTLAEAGVGGVEADAWFALFAPAQTPAAIVERLYRVVAAGLTTDAATQAIAAQGMTLALRTPAELAAWLPGEVAKWAAVIKAAGVVME